jgi:hypothetical protein
MPEPAKGPSARPAGAPVADGPTSEERGHVCTVGFCPICLAVTAVQPLRPDAVEHFVNAGRELLLAMSAILGGRAEETGGSDPAATLTRIDIQ